MRILRARACWKGGVSRPLYRVCVTLSHVRPPRAVFAWPAAAVGGATRLCESICSERSCKLHPHPQRGSFFFQGGASGASDNCSANGAGVHAGSYKWEASGGDYRVSHVTPRFLFSFFLRKLSSLRGLAQRSGIGSFDDRTNTRKGASYSYSGDQNEHEHQIDICSIQWCHS